MSKRVTVFVRSCLAIAIVFLASSLVGQAQASGPRIEFELTDEPGAWFRNTAGPVVGFQSLAVATPGTEVRFTGKSNTVHTRTSLIFPTGAINMPFDTEPRKGSDEVILHTPGLYVFTCKIHPYMFGAVIVDNPNTEGLDLGEQISLVTFPSGVGIPTSSDLATRLLRTFFIATHPANWLDYAAAGPWHVTYPGEPNTPSAGVKVRITGGAAVNLYDVLTLRYGNDLTKVDLVPPTTPAVGEIWVDTQFEKTRGKSKPGTATAISGQTWKPTRKVALPQINMNNPHNMWTDRNQNLIYQTQWFDSKLTVFNRATGQFLNNISVGESPSHVMTRVDTDQLHVALNGSPNNDSVVELAPLANGVQRRINIGAGNPHAHWMGHDGKLMLTPNAFTANSTQYNFFNNRIDAIRQTGNLPIATGMTPDSKKAYVASLLDSTITVIDTAAELPIGKIELLANYDPIGGGVQPDPVSGVIFVGGLPIQTPVAPDGKSMVTANTLTATITVVNPVTDKVVAMLPCGPGCHGVQYGAKQGGGYYAYVSSKFSNDLIVVDPDPNGDGNPADATIAGRVLLTSTAGTASDDTVTSNRGMGGQGILTIPVVYNGWVQQWVQECNTSECNSWKSGPTGLTNSQKNPHP